MAKNNDFEAIIDTININFSLISSIILTIVGLIGNSLIIYILIKPQFRNNTTFRYVFVSTLNDTLVLVTMWFYNSPNTFQLNSNSISCKFVQYFGYLFYQYCPWIIVLTSLDRLLAVKFPTRFKFRTQLKYQAIALFVIFVSLALINISFYYYYDIQIQSNQTICATSDIYTQFYIDLFSSLITTFIPLVLIVFCTSTIGCQLLSQKQLMLFNRENYKKKTQFIKVMVAMDAFFLICNLPFCIQQIIYDIFVINGITYYYESIILTFTDFFIYFQNSCGFFVYLAANKRFRKQFLFMIRRKNIIVPDS